MRPKPKFKPNLAEAGQRARVRQPSESAPPPVTPTPVVEVSTAIAPTAESVTSPVEPTASPFFPAFTSQYAASAPLPPAPVFDRRKAEHKRRFTNGVPDRAKLTMFDLIYYNPSEGSRMSTSSSRRTSRASSTSEDVNGSSFDAVVPDHLDSIKEREEEEATDDVYLGGNDNDGDSRIPAPQVKVGPNGEIIVDEESTFIETTAAKKAKEDLLKTPLVFENANGCSNYGTWGKRRRVVDWKHKETLRFYKALSIVGTDFSIMESLFKTRTRQELKLKFKKEERTNRALIDKCLREGGQFDMSIFGDDSENDEDQPSDLRKIREHSKRRRIWLCSPTGHSPAPTSDLPSSETRSQSTWPGSRRRVSSRPRLRLTLPERGQPTEPAKPHLPAPVAESRLLRGALSKYEAAAAKVPGAGQPPALPSFPAEFLAANPALANAVPGSLVVVASPAHSAGKDRQTLHVYMVKPGPTS